MARTNTLDCLGLGIIPVDLLFTVPHFPKRGLKTDASSLIIQGGGPVPNTLVGLSRMGASTAVIAAVGNDLFGQLTREELIRENVDSRFLVVKKNDLSAVAAGVIEAGNGSRTIALYRTITVEARDIDLKKLPIPKMVHLDGRDMPACMKVAKWAKTVGAQVSFDIGSVRNDVGPIFPLVDHLVVADAFALPHTKANSAEKAVDKLSKKCPGTIVVTCGIKGSYGYQQGVWVYQPAFKVRAVDTTGAGDSFHSGYLFGLLKNWSLTERLRFGAAAAALKCTKPGARTGAPTIDEVHTFLKTKPRIYA